MELLIDCVVFMSASFFTAHIAEQFFLEGGKHYEY